MDAPVLFEKRRHRDYMNGVPGIEYDSADSTSCTFDKKKIQIFAR